MGDYVIYNTTDYQVEFKAHVCKHNHKSKYKYRLFVDNKDTMLCLKTGLKKKSELYLKLDPENSRIVHIKIIIDDISSYASIKMIERDIVQFDVCKKNIQKCDNDKVILSKKLVWVDI